MGHVPLLDELAVIAVLAVAVTVLLVPLKLPTVAGLLLAGALLGPFGLGAVSSVHAIEILAEVGVVLLLFSIGLEFSLARLKDIFRQVALGGVLQVGLTILATLGVVIALGGSSSQGIFYGFVVSLSSTAIVLRALAERRELDAPHGRFIVGVLIFQDLCVVPMVLIVPLLGAGGSENALLEVGIAMGKATLVVAAIIGLARFVVPKILSLVDASRSREVFLLAIVALCIGTAWLTSLAGLSLALGAFLGGMAVADTEYGHRAMGDILPLRDAFVSIFFVSLGMLFDPKIVWEHPLLVGGLLLAFLFGKGILATFAAIAMRFPSRAAWLAGVGLAQFGEFGFVLAKLGQASGVVTAAEISPLLCAGIISMFLTPLLVRAAPHITAGERLLAPLERLLGVNSIDEADHGDQPMSGHVVLVGYGLAGRYTAQALHRCGVRCLVLELNAETVRKSKGQEIQVYYGDATSEEALHHAHLETARALVLLMNDPAAAQRVVDTAKRVAPNVPILMRTRYFAERGRLLDLGAKDVVAEEVEGAVEIIAKVLRWVEVPRNVIEEQINLTRSKTQEAEHQQTIPRPTLGSQRALEDLKIESLLLREGDPGTQQSLSQLKLRSSTNATVLAIRRHGKLVEKPDPTIPFEVGDTIYLVGTLGAVEGASKLLIQATEAT